jgi:hypothetical protein
MAPTVIIQRERERVQCNLEIKRKGESRERIEVRTSADYVYFGVSRFFFMFYGWKISFG